jgi:hypothetical protein
MFSLTEGLEAGLTLPGRSRLNARLPGALAPQKAGETGRAELLFVGVPRATAYTKHLPSASTEVVERFYHDFALDGGTGGYQLALQAGKVAGQRYVLDLDGAETQCFSGQLAGRLISSLPIRVGGLNDRWSACLLDRAQGKARPVGMFEGQAWATVSLNGALDLFVGHPVIADNPEVYIQVTQTGADSWSIEVHNPTDQAIRTTIRPNPHFDLLRALPEEALDLPPGSSVIRSPR